MNKTITRKKDISLNIDYKNQQTPIRTAITLPYGNGNGNGKSKILALIEKENLQQLDNIKHKYLKIGYKKYIYKIKSKTRGRKFEIIIATPKTMQLVSQLGQILSPKGLMPNPVLGTVTNSPQKIINEILNGKICLKSDRYGIIHSSIGRINFPNQQLLSNIQVLINYLKNKTNKTLKGELIKNIDLSSPMGTSYLIKLNL
ncbi:50S ribosomal protein L1 [Candidatus Karelsulcia muelleri]